MSRALAAASAAVVLLVLGVVVAFAWATHRPPDIDAWRSIQIGWDPDQTVIESRSIPVDDADVVTLHPAAAAAWRRLPAEGNASFVLSREDAAQYYATLAEWAERAPEVTRLRFLFHGVHYQQSELAH